MWPKLRKQIAVEREMLRQLLEDHRPLLQKCTAATPDRIEVSALGAVLHGFYNGVENIFKRVVIELGEGLSEGDRWHKALLDRMGVPGIDRPPLITAALAQDLQEILEFRHVFRTAYPIQLRWDRMAHLILGLEAIWQRLENELDAFLTATLTRG